MAAKKMHSFLRSVAGRTALRVTGKMRCPMALPRPPRMVSVVRMNLLLGCAAVVLAGTLSICYMSWLNQGCLAFLPFLSDLGLHGDMATTFTWGLRIEAAILAVWLKDLSISRHRLLTQISSAAWVTMLNFTMTSIGAGVIAGIFFIGFFPWDTYVTPHFICADAVFYGGCAWACCNPLLSWGIGQAASRHGVDLRSTLRSWQAPIGFLSCFDLFVIGVLYSAAYDWDDAGFFVWRWWLTVQTLAREDFHSYCSGQGWHEKMLINGMALLEWTLLGFCFLGMVASMPDVYLHCALQDRPGSLWNKTQETSKRKGALEIEELEDSPGPHGSCYPGGKVGSFKNREGLAIPPTLGLGRWPLLREDHSRFMMRVAGCTLLVCLGICYFDWFASGCTVLVPTFSDLGLRLQWIFFVGLFVANAVWTAFFLNLTKVRMKAWQRIIPESEGYWYVYHIAGMTGCCTMTGCFMVLGLLRWDKFFCLHLFILGVGAAGGLAWCSLSLMASIFVRCRYSVGPGLRFYVVSWSLVSGAWMGCLAAWCSFALAYNNDPQFFRWGWWHEVQRSATADFDDFCRGEGLYSKKWIWCFAVSEWIMLACIVGTIFHSQEEITLFYGRLSGASSNQDVPSCVVGRRSEVLSPLEPIENDSLLLQDDQAAAA